MTFTITHRKWYKTTCIYLAFVLLIAACVVAPSQPVQADTTTFQLNNTDATGADAFLMQGQPYTNNGGNGYLNVQSDTNDNNQRTILKFNISSIPAGSTITGATLKLNTDYISNAVGRTHWAYRLTETDWVEGTGTYLEQAGTCCWYYQQNASLDWTGAGGTYTTDGGASAIVPSSGWMEWTVADQVQYALDNTIDAHFLIKDSNENGSAHLVMYKGEGEGVNAPKLEVTYTSSTPTISSFIPTSGGTDTSVTITGTNFTGATAVKFGGTNASGFTVDTPTQITATVGSGTTGTVSVTTPDGTATSTGSFTYIPPGSSFETFQLDNTDDTGADNYLQQEQPDWNNGGYAWGLTVRSNGSWSLNKDFTDSEATRVYALAVYNDGTGEKLYAGTGLGAPKKIYVYNGTSWSLSYTLPSGNLVCSLAVYNGKLYAGSDDGKIYVKDGTNPWSLAHSFAGETNIWSLAVYNDGISEKLYANSYSGKVYVYDGSTWGTSTTKETSSGGNALAVYDGKLYAGFGTDGKIYTYDGSTWTLSYDSSATAIYSLAVYNGKLYAGTNSSGKICVTPDGTNWSESAISGAYNIYSLAVYSGNLYAGDDGGVIYVTSDGSSWGTSYDTPESWVLSLAVYNGKLYAGTAFNGKIYVSSGQNNRAVLKFDISSIPAGSTITGATLKLNIDYNLNATGRTYYAYRLKETTWVEGTGSNEIQSGSSCWNYRVYATTAWLGGGGGGTPDGTYTTTYGASATVLATGNWMEWTVADQVQYALDNTIDAHFLIRDGAEDSVTDCLVVFGGENYGANAPKLEVTYTVPISIPTVTTQAATSVEETTATGNGNITDTGGENCDERGVEWGTTSGSYTNSAADSAGPYGIGAFTKDMTGLPGGKTIYYRAKAHNSAGWGYGNEVTFHTGSSTSIQIRAQNYIDTVSIITFPAGEPGATVSTPYNNIDGPGNPQAFGGSSKPVLTLVNTADIQYTIWYNITTFENGVVSNEYYLINDKGAACASEAAIDQPVTFGTDTPATGTVTTIAATGDVGEADERDLYLKVTLSAIASGKANE